MKMKPTEPELSIPMDSSDKDALGRALAELFDTIPSTKVLHPSYSFVFQQCADAVLENNRHYRGASDATMEIVRNQVTLEIRRHIIALRKASMQHQEK